MVHLTFYFVLLICLFALANFVYFLSIKISVWQNPAPFTNGRLNHYVDNLIIWSWSYWSPSTTLTLIEWLIGNIDWGDPSCEDFLTAWQRRHCFLSQINRLIPDQKNPILIQNNPLFPDQIILILNQNNKLIRPNDSLSLNTGWFFNSPP